MRARLVAAALMVTMPAAAVDPCEEARWAGNEIIAYQRALEVVLDARLAHCQKTPKHPACPSFVQVSAALTAQIEQLTAVRAFRKKECSGG